MSISWIWSKERADVEHVFLKVHEHLLALSSFPVFLSTCFIILFPCQIYCQNLSVSLLQRTKFKALFLLSYLDWSESVLKNKLCEKKSILSQKCYFYSKSDKFRRFCFRTWFLENISHNSAAAAFDSARRRSEGAHELPSAEALFANMEQIWKLLFSSTNLCSIFDC